MLAQGPFTFIECVGHHAGDIGIDSCRPIMGRWAAHKNKTKSLIDPIEYERGV